MLSIAKLIIIFREKTDALFTPMNAKQQKVFNALVALANDRIVMRKCNNTLILSEAFKLVDNFYGCPGKPLSRSKYESIYLNQLRKAILHPQVPLLSLEARIEGAFQQTLYYAGTPSHPRVFPKDILHVLTSRSQLQLNAIIDDFNRTMLFSVGIEGIRGVEGSGGGSEGVEKVKKDSVRISFRDNVHNISIIPRNCYISLSDEAAKCLSRYSEEGTIFIEYLQYMLAIAELSREEYSKILLELARRDLLTCPIETVSVNLLPPMGTGPRDIYLYTAIYAAVMTLDDGLNGGLGVGVGGGVGSGLSGSNNLDEFVSRIKAEFPTFRLED